MPPSMVPEFTRTPAVQENENRCHDVVAVNAALPKSVFVISPRSSWIDCVPLAVFAQIENVQGVALGFALMICWRSAAWPRVEVFRESVLAEVPALSGPAALP